MIDSVAMAMYTLGFLQGQEPDPEKQKILLDLAAFLSKHANEINDKENINSPLPNNR
jgi:hypothetical protein